MIGTKRILKITLWAIVVFFIVINMLVWGFSLLLQNTMTQDKIIKIFINNENCFNDLTQCFFDNNINDMNINLDNYKEQLYLHGEEYIECASTLLEDNSVERIYREKNYLYFVIGHFKDFVQGILYSDNGEIPYIKEADRIIFSVLKPNWYYYEIVE